MIRIVTVFRAFRNGLAVLLLALTVSDLGAVELVTSPDDQRAYEYFVLPNQLQVVLISDPDTDKAAAALDVHVGSSADPEGRQGLAHFLEHMLFLGTEKFPAAGEYQQFINEHGGTHNAYTAFEDTNYFFDIDREYLVPALDRFSQFFVAPLFNADYVEREKHAVHSEYQAKLKDDELRIYAALRQAANPEHPLSRFSVGSLETLSDRDDGTLRAQLLDFHKRYYSANLMTLVVLGHQPLADLKEIVTARFSQVPNRSARPLEIKAPLFRPGQLPAELRIVPLRDRRTLMLSFPLPPLRDSYRSKPVDQIANLLGHEGTGSLLALLKHRAWADGLSAGQSLDESDCSAFTVTIALTREGLEHTEEIVGLVFQYLRLIKQTGIERWRFDEQKRLYDIKFRFAQRQRPIEYVSAIAGNLQYYPPRDVLRVRYRLDLYEPKLIASFLDRLSPSKVLVSVVAPNQVTNAVEHWYGTPYAITRLAPSQLDQWRQEPIAQELALPKPNPFIPDRLALKELSNPTDHPVRIVEQRGLELWHQQDESFRQPRSTFYFSVRSKHANSSAANSDFTELYVRLIKDELNEFSYPALLAGLQVNLYTHVRGFTVKISGFSDKQEILLERVVSTLRNPEYDAERFARIKDELLRELENTIKDRPYAQTMREVSNLLIEPYWTVAQRIKALKPIELQGLRDYVDDLWRQDYIVALSHGNVLPAEAEHLGSMVSKVLVNPARAENVPPARILKLRDGDDYVRELEIEHPDSAITTYYQGRDRTARSRAAFELLGQVIAAPFFDELRTHKQLGYVVFAGSSPLMDVPGMVFVVQSPKADPILLDTSINDFLVHLETAIDHMPRKVLESHKQGVITRIMEAEDRLEERSDRYWNEIDLGHYDFDSREQLVSALGTISVEDFQRYYRTSLLRGHRRRLSIRSVGENHSAQVSDASNAVPRQLIRDPETFGAGMEYFYGELQKAAQAYKPKPLRLPGARATRYRSGIAAGLRVATGATQRDGTPAQSR